MASRSALLTATQAGRLLDHIRTRDGSEPAERVLADGYAPGATSLSALARDGVPMTWTGSAAERLGLTGEAAETLAAKIIKYGRGPNGEPLRTRTQPGQAQGRDAAERRPAWGWVVSAPKTVSLLLMAADPAVRDAARQAVLQAGQAAIAVLEACLTVRRGHAGANTEHVAGLCGVQAVHYTSSAADPHLHIHFVLNASAPSAHDGQWRALDSRVLFASQRMAEAAFQATLRRELDRDLDLRWTLHAVGPVPTWEIADLEPAVDRYSRARAHMRDVATRLGKVLGPHLSRDQDSLIWKMHRQEEPERAEAVEHLLDSVLAQAGDAAEALRQDWRNALGPQQAVLDALRLRDQPLALDDLAPRDAPETIAALTHPDAAREAAEKAMADLEAFRAKHRIQRQGRLPEAGIRQAVANYLAGYDIVRTHNALLDAAEAAQAKAALAEAAQQTTRTLLADLAERLGPFIPADVTAHYLAHGYNLQDARRLTAATIRYWHSQGLIRLPESRDLDTLCAAIERGYSPSTAQQHAVWSHCAKIVPDLLLQREAQIAAGAREAAQQQRRQLAIDLAGLSPDQALAAATIAQGRALTCIQGVAGAGKTHLMRPVVQAARHRDMAILVLSRNAKLAHELGDELGVPSSTLAAFAARAQHIARPTLLIVDEAGLVDQQDWQTVLLAATNRSVQIVAIGDRLQAQPIDRLATWAVVSQAAQDAGAYAELTQTFRCKEWQEEHDALRRADPDLATRIPDDRMTMADQDSATSAAANLVLERRALGEDALAIAATNEEAALIAKAIQAATGVQIDPHTRLRWGQRTGPGDTVRTRQNMHRIGVRNGDTWTVAATDQSGVSLQSRDGRRIRVSHDWTAQHLELAYAATADSAQGVTVDRAIVLLSPMLGRSRLYSAATRGRYAPIYVAASMDAATPREALAVCLRRDDIAPTMREILAANDQARHLSREAISPPQDWGQAL